jgi:hypothetical protein
MRISVREGGATKLKLVPSTSGSNRALSPMPKAAQANNHVDKKRSAIPRHNLVPIAIRTEAPVNEEINGTIISIYLLCFCFIPICYHLHFFIAIFVLHTKQVNQIQVQQLFLVLLVLLEMLPNRGGCTTLPNCLVSPSICSHPFLVLSMSVECD